MKTNLEQLRELLCEVDYVREDLMGLKEWGKIRNIYNTHNVINNKKYVVLMNDWWSFEIDIPKIVWMKSMRHLYFNSIRIDEELWNPLEERHLRMYCESKNIYMEIYKWQLNILDEGCMNVLFSTEYDDKHSLQNQSEETLWEIVGFLQRHALHLNK